MGGNVPQHIEWKCQNFFTEYKGKGQKLKEIRKLYYICYIRSDNQMTELLKKPREDSLLRSTKECISQRGASDIKNVNGGCPL